MQVNQFLFIDIDLLLDLLVGHSQLVGMFTFDGPVLQYFFILYTYMYTYMYTYYSMNLKIIQRSIELLDTVEN